MPPSNPHIKWHTWPEGVEYTDENDHNPVVHEECPACLGIGEREEVVEATSPNGGIEWMTCPTCGGTGHTERRVRLFDNDSPAMLVDVGRDGWLSCPCCKWFGKRDRSIKELDLSRFSFCPVFLSERYIDPAYKFAGIASAVRYLISKRSP